MTIISKYQVQWVGGTGLPGLSTFYFSSTAAIPHTAVKGLFSPVAGAIPSGITLRFPSSGMNIDDATGQPTGTWTAPPPTDLLGTGTGNYSAACGSLINWHTGIFQGGRELRGKTFFVPFVSGSFTASGTVSASTQTSLMSGVPALLTGSNPPLIYSRRYGLSRAVASASVPNKAIVLTSRRD